SRQPLRHPVTVSLSR
ncbi:hypothetical protein N499_1269B, partial [Wolbachia pipientis wVitA]